MYYIHRKCQINVMHCTYTLTLSVAVQFINPLARPGPIILFKLPIMLLSKFSLLCPNYAPLH